MSIALKRENGDVIFFDAVLGFGRAYSGEVTKHPIEDGSSIADHAFTENVSITIKGIITNADFNRNRPNLSQADKEFFGINSEKGFVNNNPVDSAVEISDRNNKYLKKLPESISQFIPDLQVDVSVDAQKLEDFVFSFEELLKDIQRKIERVNILEFDYKNKNSSRRLYEGYVITSLNFEESPDTGDALDVSLTLEKVEIVSTKTVNVKDYGVIIPTKDPKGKQDEKSGGDMDKDKNKASQSLLKKGVNIFTSGDE